MEKETKGYYIRLSTEEFIEPEKFHPQYKYKAIDPKTNEEIEFNSRKELIDRGYDLKFITDVCKGKKHRKTAYGLKWERYLND